MLRRLPHEDDLRGLERVIAHELELKGVGFPCVDGPLHHGERHVPDVVCFVNYVQFHPFLGNYVSGFFGQALSESVLRHYF